MPARKRPFDLILWGATGFTGRLVAEYLAGQYDSSDLRWALAGRNREKLERLRRQLGENDRGCPDLPIRTANAKRPRTLLPLVNQANVICSTVGPYALYGTPLVKACVERDTDYCDLTGEVPWMRRMIDRFHDRARNRGTRIVHACGFDAVPSDLGTLMVQKKAQERFGSCCRTIRTYVESEGAQVSGGTVASMMEVFEETDRNVELRRLLNDPYSLVPGKTGKMSRTTGGWNARYDDWIDGWTVPFFMERINRSVVYRSIALRGNIRDGKFRYREFVPCGSGVTGALGSMAAAAGLTGFERLMNSSSVRDALRIFLPSPGEGPDRTARENGSFRVTLIGRGRRSGDGSPFFVTGTIASDQDPGYGSTARMLGEAAVCLALQEGASPLNGGVLTPASAIGLPMVDRLRGAGIRCSVKSSTVATRLM